MIYRVSSTSYNDGTVDQGVMHCDKDNYTLNSVQGDDYCGGIKIYIYMVFIDTDSLGLLIGEDPTVVAFSHGKTLIETFQFKKSNFWYDELGKVRV